MRRPKPKLQSQHLFGARFLPSQARISRVRFQKQERRVRMTKAIAELYSALRRQFKGELLRPGDGEFANARGIWNGLVTRTPGLIARCADVEDVQAAVRTGAKTGMLTAIRCGGHSLAGFSTCDGGLVIDLNRMRSVSV